LIAVTGIGAGDSKGHGGSYMAKCLILSFSELVMTKRIAKKPSSRQAMWIG